MSSSDREGLQITLSEFGCRAIGRAAEVEKRSAARKAKGQQAGLKPGVGKKTGVYAPIGKSGLGNSRKETCARGSTLFYPRLARPGLGGNGQRHTGGGIGMGQGGERGGE